MARSDPQTSRRREVSPILIAAGHAALEANRRRTVGELLRLLDQVAGQCG